MAADPTHPVTPDGRYFAVRGRLWRRADPSLPETERERLVAELMTARRAVRAARGEPDALAEARGRVDAAKRSLGERGPGWWTDGAPDYNRRAAASTPYADWFAAVSGGTEPASTSSAEAGCNDPEPGEHP